MPKKAQTEIARKTSASGSPERRALERAANSKIMPKDFWDNEAVPPWAKVQSLTAEKMVAILTDVASGKSITTSAESHGTSLWAVQRQRIADVGFGEAMNQALEIRETLLEEKAWELTHTGVVEQVTKGYGEDRVTEERTTYPPWQLGQFMLKAFKPDKYGIDRQEIKAGPLETPPEVVRSESDRDRLMKKLEERRAGRELPPAEPGLLEAEVVDNNEEESDETFNDLL